MYQTILQKLDNIHLSSDVIFPVTTVLSASCEPLVSLSVRSKQDAIRVLVNIVFFAYNVTYPLARENPRQP
jgi:hypothetical protein